MIQMLVSAALLVGLAAACGSTGSGATSAPPSPHAVAMSLYCADLAQLDASLTLAGSDPAKQGAAEAKWGPSLAADADRLGAAGDATAARNVRMAALALQVDAQIRQQADPDPALLSHSDADAASALKAAPNC